jgi:predicted AAA+ superfamily ATPase
MDELTAWLSRRGRKPLVVRGARQVGKSYLIRDFARASSLDLVELNFERDPKAANLFADGDATRLLRNVEAFTGKRLAYGRSLLFLDEIQAAPQILAKLRWLHEETPKLAVVAAGSLLDFALADHTFSMPD